MALSPCADLSAASWLTTSDEPWDRLVRFGPPGFAAYARLRFLPDPVYPGQSENDVEVEEDDEVSESALLQTALNVLAGHTKTPDDCYFCLWDGDGNLEGGNHVQELDTRTDTVRPGPRVAPAFPPAVLYGPRVVVPNRAYILFRGPLSAVGDWGAAELWPGQPRFDMSNPAFVWPADHAWCVAKDVDPH